MPMEWIPILDHHSTKDKATLLMKLKYEMTIEDVHDLSEYQSWMSWQNHEEYLKHKEEENRRKQSMQIAKMFASLGFNVDTSGLDKFRQNIKLARTDITNMGRDAGTASTKLTGLSKALDGLSNKLDKVSVKKVQL